MNNYRCINCPHNKGLWGILPCGLTACINPVPETKADNKTTLFEPAPLSRKEVEEMIADELSSAWLAGSEDYAEYPSHIKAHELTEKIFGGKDV
ncbi:MAG: hypothetical protein EOM59_11675 [Clostridia bacterium]|nr:hypothetical protein [Clostridia bacterium]